MVIRNSEAKHKVVCFVFTGKNVGKTMTRKETPE